jgi:hypothetical protein
MRFYKVEKNNLLIISGSRSIKIETSIYTIASQDFPYYF